ncbi:DUF402 domain-containing protein [Bacillaceae bacterium SIJ1]|uniref:DUF402 domain-containing protein n=1 Tax=Litoribacterium kuwaitense TaxID=1398745 RepID=UPI0013EC8B0B|nr:DUF402 domain-containing protein [Litoribacterium kuwaitense]NGP46577.1 DUF402 domain-containing protein [Litoribacterium kuwaitense]
MNARLGDVVQIESIKHSGQFHRHWAKTEILHCTDRELIGVNDHTLVTEADGTQWVTSERALCFFWTDRWYHVIAMEGENGWSYYCNLASPLIWKTKRKIQYIDYDIDYYVDVQGNDYVLDRDEFADRAEKEPYSAELIQTIHASLEELQTLYQERSGVFAPGTVSTWITIYDEFK